MLIIQKGNCKKCGSEFGSMATVQSTNVECSKCKTIVDFIDDSKMCYECS